VPSEEPKLEELQFVAPPPDVRGRELRKEAMWYSTSTVKCQKEPEPSGAAQNAP